MRYNNYFRDGQKILMKSLANGNSYNRFEILTVYFRDLGPGYFDLELPYRARGSEHYPFETGMPFELLSDAFGLGVRMTATYLERQTDDIIRLRINNDLQIFQRRVSPRLELEVGIRYTKARGRLRSFKEQWEKNVEILQTTNGAMQLPNFESCPVNISRGGLGLRLKSATEVADLCLMLLNLGADARPICALAEVVWLEKGNRDIRKAGLQFLNILEEDRARIDQLVRKTLPRSQPSPFGFPL